jgi:hypothetical protein
MYRAILTFSCIAVSPFVPPKVYAANAIERREQAILQHATVGATPLATPVLAHRPAQPENLAAVTGGDVREKEPAAQSPSPAKPADARQSGELYATRARHKLEQKPPLCDEVIGEGMDELRRGVNLSEVHGVLAAAYLRRAEMQLTRRALMADLKSSISEGEQAAASSANDSESVSANYLLTLSQAYLERTNYDNDSFYQENGGAANDLKKAVECAEKAAKLGRDQKDHPYLAAGHAYEDLAWLTEIDPAKNYKRAIRCFRTAAANSTAPAYAYCSIGRCYYKAVADTWLAPHDLDKSSMEGIFHECMRAFNDALTRDPDHAESFEYRGLMHDYYARFLSSSGPQKDEARKWFILAGDDYASAKRCADKQQLPHRAYYAVTWAESPLGDETIADPQKRNETAATRAAQLAKYPPPPGGVMLPQKEIARITGTILRYQEKCDEAISLIDRAIGGDDSDFSLLLTAARLRIEQAGKLDVKDAAKNDILQRAAVDAAHARMIAIGRTARINAAEWEFQADGKLYFATSPNQTREKAERHRKAVQDAVQLVDLAPRRPRRPVWAEECAKLLFDCDRTDPGRQPPATVQSNLEDLSQAMKWLDYAIGLTVSNGQRVARISAMKIVMQEAARYREGVTAAKVPINPNVLAEFDKRLGEIKKKYHLE